MVNECRVQAIPSPPVANSWNPAVGGTPVSSADWIQMLADIAQALSDSVSFTAGQKQAYLWGGVAGVLPMPSPDPIPGDHGL